MFYQRKQNQKIFENIFNLHMCLKLFKILTSENQLKKLALYVQLSLVHSSDKWLIDCDQFVDVTLGCVVITLPTTTDTITSID